MKIRITLLFVIAWSCLGFSSDSSIWNRSAYDIYESDIRSILIDQRNNDNIYVGTSKALYRSSDRGRNYQVILMPSGQQNPDLNVIIITGYKSVETASEASSLGASGYIVKPFQSDEILEAVGKIIKV